MKRKRSKCVRSEMGTGYDTGYDGRKRNSKEGDRAATGKVQCCERAKVVRIN